MTRRVAAAALAASVLLALAPSAGAAAPDRVGLVPPLEGTVVVLDPGHQLGNHNFPRRIHRLVPAGGFRKPCNTTGTATNGGYPEASLTWDVAVRLREQLRALGATVRMTRHGNRQDEWGPCVDARGRAGNREHADLKLSIHADGSFARGAHGFHVIMPPDRGPWTHDIYRASRRLALVTRAALLERGLHRATYVAGGDGLDVRRDLGTLNLSDVPTVMVELGNMRDRRDAAMMTRPGGRDGYARALGLAVRRFLESR
jgi:N-acetylmuramoyl-L-alanine amidase